MKNFAMLALIAMLSVFVAPAVHADTPTASEWTVSLDAAPDWLSLSKIGIDPSLLDDVYAVGLDGTEYSGAASNLPGLNDLESLELSGGSIQLNLYWRDGSVSTANVKAFDLQWNQEIASGHNNRTFVVKTSGLKEVAAKKAIKKTAMKFAGHLLKSLILSDDKADIQLSLAWSDNALNGQLDVGAISLGLGEESTDEVVSGGWELSGDVTALGGPLVKLIDKMPEICREIRENDPSATTAALLEYALPFFQALAVPVQSVKDVKLSLSGNYDSRGADKVASTLLQLTGADGATLLGMGLSASSDASESKMVLTIHNEREAMGTLANWLATDAIDLLAAVLKSPSIKYYRHVGAAFPNAVAYLLRTVGEEQANGDLVIRVVSSADGSLVIGGVDIANLSTLLYSKLPRLPAWNPWG